MINNMLEYPEHGLYRAVTGSATVFPIGEDGVPTTIATFPVKGTIPIARIMTGTISSTGVSVRGTGTLFESQVKIGDYLYDADASVRKIKSIETDTLLTLEAAFPADVVGITVRKCEPQTFKVIQAENTSTDTAAELQEAPFAAGSRIISWGSPIAYDATAGVIAFTVSK